MKNKIPAITVAFLSLLSLFVSGCASGAMRAPSSLNQSYKVDETHKLSSVTISLSSEAKEKLKDNLKFDQEELRKHLERAFEGLAFMDKAKKSDAVTLEILVTGMRIRSNFSSIMWGPMAGADSIRGEIVIKDARGQELDRFKVSASYALGGVGTGEDLARMSWLYEAFAKETVKELTGARK